MVHCFVTSLVLLFVLAVMFNVQNPYLPLEVECNTIHMRLVQHLLEIHMNVKTLIHYGNPTMEMGITNIVVIATIADGKDNVQELQIIVQEVHPVIVQEVHIALVDLLTLIVQEVHIAQVDLLTLVGHAVHLIVVLIIQIVHVVVAIAAQEATKIQENLPYMTSLEPPVKILEVFHLKLNFLVISIEENRNHFINFRELLEERLAQ